MMLVWQLGPGERENTVGVAVTPGAMAKFCLAWRKSPALSLGPGNPHQLAQEPRGFSTAGVCPGSMRPPGPALGPGAPIPLTTEALPAGAHIAAGHVLAGASVDAGVRLTLIVVDVTVGPTPPGVTVTLVPAEATTRRLRCSQRGRGLGWEQPRLCYRLTT